MANLHLLFSSNALHRLPLAKDDALVLLNDAVLLAMHNVATIKNPVYARAADIEARGLNNLALAQTQVINDEQWVALCLQFDKTLSWI